MVSICVETRAFSELLKNERTRAKNLRSKDSGWCEFLGVRLSEGLLSQEHTLHQGL